MSDIAKWAILVAGMLTIIGMAVLLLVTVGEFQIASTVAGAINSCVYYVGNLFIAAKGVLNHFANPYLWNFLLWTVFTYPIAKFSIRVTSFIYKWIFK